MLSAEDDDEDGGGGDEVNIEEHNVGRSRISPRLQVSSFLDLLKNGESSHMENVWREITGSMMMMLMMSEKQKGREELILEFYEGDSPCHPVFN